MLTKTPTVIAFQLGAICNQWPEAKLIDVNGHLYLRQRGLNWPEKAINYMQEGLRREAQEGWRRAALGLNGVCALHAWFTWASAGWTVKAFVWLLSHDCSFSKGWHLSRVSETLIHPISLRPLSTTSCVCNWQTRPGEALETCQAARSMPARALALICVRFIKTALESSESGDLSLSLSSIT